MSMFNVNFPKLELVQVKQLQPIGRQVIIVPIEIPKIQETKSGLLVVAQEMSSLDDPKFPLRFGQVFEVGQDVQGYQKGDFVYFHKYEGQDGDVLENTFLQMDSANIWGLADLEVKTIE